MRRYHNFILTWISPEKPLLVFVQIQKFGTGTRCVLEILQECGKWMQTESEDRKFGGLIHTFRAVTREVLVGDLLFPLS